MELLSQRQCTFTGSADVSIFSSGVREHAFLDSCPSCVLVSLLFFGDLSEKMPSFGVFHAVFFYIDRSSVI